MTAACPESVPFDTLVAYLSGELAEAEPAFEEHLFACDSCTARLAGLAELGTAVAELAGRGRVFACVTGAHLRRVGDHGLRIREYRLQPGESVQCTIAPDDDANVIRLAAEFDPGDRVDLDVYLLDADPSVPTDHREDLAVDHSTGEVLLLYPGDAIRELPRCRFRLELTVAGDAGRRGLGSYTLDHAPWPEGRSDGPPAPPVDSRG